MARKKSLAENLGIKIPLALMLLFTVIPFYWMITLALRERGSTALVPWPITFDHFVYVWEYAGFATYFGNSVIVSVATVILTVVISMLGGYALARFQFRTKPLVLIVLLATQFVPGALMLIPLFEIFRSVGLVNNLGSLIVADVVFQLPLCMMLMTGYIQSVPTELEEAAWIDGNGRFMGFVRVMMPLLVPATVAVGSFAFIGAWNNFLFALIFLNDSNLYTIPVGLSFLIGEQGVDFNVLAAGGLLALLPVVAIFAYVQKFLVSGLTAGAVKG